MKEYDSFYMSDTQKEQLKATFTKKNLVAFLVRFLALFACCGAMLLALVLGGCGERMPSGVPSQTQGGAAVQGPAQQATAPEGALLTKAQAEAIALNHAGLTATQVTRLRSEFDIDDGVKEWGVEFRFDGWEYEYEIDAESGAVRSFDREKD